MTDILVSSYQNQTPRLSCMDDRRVKLVDAPSVDAPHPTPAFTPWEGHLRVQAYTDGTGRATATLWSMGFQYEVEYSAPIRDSLVRHDRGQGQMPDWLRDEIDTMAVIVHERINRPGQTGGQESSVVARVREAIRLHRESDPMTAPAAWDDTAWEGRVRWAEMALAQVEKALVETA